MFFNDFFSIAFPKLRGNNVYFILHLRLGGYTNRRVSHSLLQMAAITVSRMIHNKMQNLI